MDIDRLRAITPPGMPFWASTGPEGKTCETCVHFGGKPKRSGIGKGDMQKGRCAEYVRINMRGARCAPTFLIPPKTPACRHYQERRPEANKDAA
jgi:hypothetical protein